MPYQEIGKRAAALRKRIEDDSEEIYQLCKQGLSICGFQADAREFSLIEEARIELASPLARFHIVCDKLAVRL